MQPRQEPAPPQRSAHSRPATNGRPFAAILRVWRQDENRVVEELLVAKVERTGSCRVGSVDVRRADANEAAGELADGAAPGFACGRDQPAMTTRRRPSTSRIIRSRAAPSSRLDAKRDPPESTFFQ